jgi:hypothetical protein
VNCEISKNFHFIPEIFITNHTDTANYDLAQFKDTDNLEYKLAICDIVGGTGESRYLLDVGIDIFGT